MSETVWNVEWKNIFRSSTRNKSCLLISWKSGVSASSYLQAPLYWFCTMLLGQSDEQCDSVWRSSDSPPSVGEVVYQARHTAHWTLHLLKRSFIHSFIHPTDSEVTLYLVNSFQVQYNDIELNLPNASRSFLPLVSSRLFYLPVCRSEWDAELQRTTGGSWSSPRWDGGFPAGPPPGGVAVQDIEKHIELHTHTQAGTKQV